QGTEILFTVEREEAPLRVFTTRPDTLHGCTFVALAPEHPLLDRMTLEPEDRERVEQFRRAVMTMPAGERALPGSEKLGVYTGRHAVNPVNGERVPIWTANYVLMEYGTGAIMAVPAHDERDFAFAVHYQLPIRQVVVQ